MPVRPEASRLCSSGLHRSRTQAARLAQHPSWPSMSSVDSVQAQSCADPDSPATASTAGGGGSLLHLRRAAHSPSRRHLNLALSLSLSLSFARALVGSCTLSLSVFLLLQHSQRKRHAPLPRARARCLCVGGQLSLFFHTVNGRASTPSRARARPAGSVCLLSTADEAPVSTTLTPPLEHYTTSGPHLH